jgi:hypothetical protein
MSTAQSRSDPASFPQNDIHPFKRCGTPHLQALLDSRSRPNPSSTSTRSGRTTNPSIRPRPSQAAFKHKPRSIGTLHGPFRRNASKRSIEPTCPHSTNLATSARSASPPLDASNRSCRRNALHTSCRTNAPRNRATAGTLIATRRLHRLHEGAKTTILQSTCRRSLSLS